MVDITAVQGAPGIIYKAFAVLFTGGQNKVSDNRCAGINTVAAWSTTGPGACSINTVNPDAISICNGYLNCNNYVNYSGNCPCLNPIFTNVVTTSTNNTSNNNSSMLYYKDVYNSCDNSTLSAAQQQSYVNNIQSYAVTNIPASPPGMVISNYNIGAGVIVLNLPHIHTFWTLDISYATVGCGRCWHN